MNGNTVNIVLRLIVAVAVRHTTISTLKAYNCYESPPILTSENIQLMAEKVPALKVCFSCEKLFYYFLFWTFATYV